MRIKVASEVTALLAAHDAAKLYDSLEPWQQRELLCLLRRIINSLPSHFRFLTQMVLPMSKEPLMTVLIFAFIGSWNAFLWPLLVTTKPTWRPLMVGLYTFVTEAGPETQLLMAGAVITLIPILILYFLTQKQFTEGIASTGIKG